MITGLIIAALAVWVFVAVWRRKHDAITGLTAGLLGGSLLADVGPFAWFVSLFR